MEKFQHNKVANNQVIGKKQSALATFLAGLEDGEDFDQELAPRQPSEEDEEEEEGEVVHEEEDMSEIPTPRPKEFGNATTAYVTASLNGYPVNAPAHPIKRKNAPNQTQRGWKPTGREKQNKS